MIRNLIAATLLAMLSGAAFASSCPIYMNEIDQALADPQVTEALSERELAKVKDLREQGETFHEQGQHEESVQALEQAREVLGLS
ncbi:MAG: hypothetical protein ACODAC_01705 [Pseudomonadota bacterium]